MEKNLEEPQILEMPVAEYTHTHLDRRVLLVGMIHIGDESYCKEVQQMVGERESDGATVHYEMVRRPSEEELTEASKLTLRKLGMLSAIMRGGIYSWLDGTGLVRQSTSLWVGKNWQNHDATLMKTAEDMPLAALSFQYMAFRGVSAVMSRYSLEDRIEIVTNVLAKGKGSELITEPRKRIGAVGRLIMGDLDVALHDRRNEAALTGVDEHAASFDKSDLVLIWGAGHLHDLSKGLEQRGYAQTDISTLAAIDLDRLRGAAVRQERE